MVELVRAFDASLASMTAPVFGSRRTCPSIREITSREKKKKRKIEHIVIISKSI
jgi:hypothetical protein